MNLYCKSNNDSTECYTDNEYNEHQNGILLSARDHVLSFLNLPYCELNI